MIDRDLVALPAALAVHVALGVALAMTPQRSPRDHQIINVDITRRQPPPPMEKPPPEVPKEPPLPHQKQRRPPPLAKAPPPNQKPPPPTPVKPPPPMFGVTMDSTTEGPSGISVPVGNTTVADPQGARKAGPVAPLPAAPVAGSDFVPASPLDVSREPELDDDPFSRLPYPDGEAKSNGIEGETLLRIEVDAGGRVHHVRVVKGVGGGLPGRELDRWAVQQAYHCKFKPARDRAGKAVAYVITAYRVVWQLNP